LTKLAGWNAEEWYGFAGVYAVASAKIADKKPEYADRAMGASSEGGDGGLQGRRTHGEGSRPRSAPRPRGLQEIACGSGNEVPPEERTGPAAEVRRVTGGYRRAARSRCSLYSFSHASGSRSDRSARAEAVRFRRRSRSGVRSHTPPQGSTRGRFSHARTHTTSGNSAQRTGGLRPLRRSSQKRPTRFSAVTAQATPPVSLQVSVTRSRNLPCSAHLTLSFPALMRSPLLRRGRSASRIGRTGDAAQVWVCAFWLVGVFTQRADALPTPFSRPYRLNTP